MTVTGLFVLITAVKLHRISMLYFPVVEIYTSPVCTLGIFYRQRQLSVVNSRFHPRSLYKHLLAEAENKILH